MKSIFIYMVVINIQNNRIWAHFQPNQLIEQPLHDEKVLVWCVFSANFMYAPFFFENTVNWQNYLEMLKNFFWPIHKKVPDYQQILFHAR